MWNTIFRGYFSAKYEIQPWWEEKKGIGGKMVLEVLEAEIACHSERIGLENHLKIILWVKLLFEKGILTELIQGRLIREKSILKWS